MYTYIHLYIYNNIYIIHTYAMAIQDPHSTACETTIFAGSLAILVADDSYELQSYVWWWHPHFSWFGFLESTSIPTFVPWISLKSRIRLRPWLPHLADLHQTLSQRAIAQEALDIFQITQGVPRWGDSYESLGMMWCFFSGKPQASGHDSGWQHVEIYSKKNVKAIRLGVTKQILLIQNICSHT